MSAVALRRLLHLCHVLATFALLATGLLLTAPDLRARLLGGYGREVSQLHEWSAWIFLAAPALALAWAPRWIVADLRRRLAAPDFFAWRGLHLASTLLLSLLLGGSGVILWVDADVPLPVLDGALEVHLFATWILAAVVPLHLIAAREKLTARVREILGRGPEPGDPLLEPDDRDA